MGIPVAQICSMTLVATMVGSPRVVPSRSVLHPTGDPALDASGERALRRRIVEQALQSLTQGGDHAA